MTPIPDESPLVAMYCIYRREVRHSSYHSKSIASGMCKGLNDSISACDMIDNGGYHVYAVYKDGRKEMIE